MPINPRVFFDFSVENKPLGRVVFELFADIVPKTAENFRALCTGEKGISHLSSRPLHYKRSIIHRVIEGFMIQGGDFTKHTGSGGESIYGQTFEDERLQGDGCDTRLLVMANRGPNTNGSQYFVTLAPATHLTGKHVVFGRVVFGLEHIMEIGELPTDDRNRPLSSVVISHCGELEYRRPVPRIRSPSTTPSRPLSPSRSPSPRRRSKKHADSGSNANSDGFNENYSRHKRHKRGKSSRKEGRRSKSELKNQEEETLEELDARLEREENELLEKERVTKLVAMKKQLEEERQRIREEGGVIYKGQYPTSRQIFVALAWLILGLTNFVGRGNMRFIDPETAKHPTLSQHRIRTHSSNYSRQRPIYEKHNLDRPGRYSRYQEMKGNKRERENTKEKLEKDMDRWQHDRSQMDQSLERKRFQQAKGTQNHKRRDNESPEKIEKVRPASVTRSESSDMVLEADD
nr:hypothetical protein L203_03348 [Cryptococcus depauperatus CBS 7841]